MPYKRHATIFTAVVSGTFVGASIALGKLMSEVFKFEMDHIIWKVFIIILAWVLFYLFVIGGQIPLFITYNKLSLVEKKEFWIEWLNGAKRFFAFSFTVMLSVFLLSSFLGIMGSE